jgi:hypothetical protein
MSLRLSGREDFEEDLYLTIRELVENFGVPPSSIRRMVNQAIRGTPGSVDLRSRVLPAPLGSGKFAPGTAEEGS